MKIGVMNEIETGDEGVVLVPQDAKMLCKAGHDVLIEDGAGAHILSMEDYTAVGVHVVSRERVLADAELVVQVNAPREGTFGQFKNKILLTMVHPPGYPERVEAIKENNIQCVALEALQDDRGTRLVECVEMCGVAVIYALQFIKKIPPEIDAAILGYGNVGSAAIKWCNKLGINLKIVRRSEFSRLNVILENKDLLINALDWPTDKRRKKEFLITEDLIDCLTPDAVVLDLIAHAGGGACKTCRPTSLKDPYFKKQGRIHICLDPFPGLYPKSTSRRYSRQLLPIIREIAENNGLDNIGKRSAVGSYIERAVIS